MSLYHSALKKCCWECWEFGLGSCVAAQRPIELAYVLFEMLYLSVRLLLISSGRDGVEMREQSKLLVDSRLLGCNLGVAIRERESEPTWEKHRNRSTSMCWLVYCHVNVFDSAH